MQVLKVILMIADIILALAIVVIVMMQKQDDQGLSGTITGAAANNFLDKNKGRTREGKLKKWTIIFGIAFTIMTVVLNIIYPLAK